MGVVVFLAVFFIMACAQCTAAAGAAFESYENKRCNDDDMLTFYDDQCRERCEGSDSCAAYVVFSGSRCSLYQVRLDRHVNQPPSLAQMSRKPSCNLELRDGTLSKNFEPIHRHVLWPKQQRVRPFMSR